MKSFCLFAAILAATLCPSLFAQSAPPVVANRIVAPIESSQRVTLAGNVHPMAQARYDIGPAPQSMATGRILLVLQRSAAQQQALTDYLADVQNPGSASYHKWLTPAQYGAQFGISDSDLQTVESWLASYGFKVEGVPAARNVVEFSGTVGQVESAFNTSIHSFAVLGTTHHANVSDPQIPAALAPVVAGVVSLNDFHPTSHVVTGPVGHYDAAAHRIEPDLTFSGPSLYVVPADAATIYDTPNTALNANYPSGTTYDGTGVSIGILGTSDLTLADVQNYRMAFLGETSSTINLPTVVVEGNDPGMNSAGVEALLDAEVSGGIAPKAKLYFYTSADTDLTSGLFGAALRAVDDNAVSIISMSFGACEQALGGSTNTFVNELAEQAEAQGISVVVSAGDGGSAGCDSFDTQTQAQYGLAVNGFASTPWTIAVGGTDFDGLPAAFSTYVNTAEGSAPYYGTALKYIPENPWNDSTTVNTTYANNLPFTNSKGNGNIIAGSGGVSSCSTQTSAGACAGGYAKPAFQSSMTLSDQVRDVPDVSLFASNGFEHASWAVCSDNVTDQDSSSTYTDCLTANGQLQPGATILGVGGTSASAPAFAGMLALVVQAQGGARLGQADTILYQLAKAKYATVFHDVTVGNNSVPCVSASPNCGTNGFLTGYNAGSNYDVATGLGSVDVNQMITNWNSVALTSTSTTLQLNGSTAAYTGVHGASVTFKVGVTPTSATGAAAVIDTANQTPGGPANGPLNNGQIVMPLTSGAGTATYNGLPGGTYTVSARYGGDTSNAASTSTAINVTISAEPSTTTLQPSAYNPLTYPSGSLNLSAVPYGAAVFLDAQITGTAEGSNTQGLATGVVTFLDGTATLGTGTVTANGNIASWPPLNANFATLPVGAHTITAKYAGDSSFSTSTSSASTVTVVKATTALAASASPNSISATQSTTVTVALSTPLSLGVNPSGGVTLTANGATLATITSFTASETGTSPNLSLVLTGTATIAGSQLQSGSANTITATYAGDGNYAGSSGTTSVTVGSGSGGSASIALTSSGNITVAKGATTGNTSTITVTPGG
ncbi:MAG: protease pro-enzyme activation domain-containing protein, partial [Acidobacteriota bacterium]